MNGTGDPTGSGRAPASCLATSDSPEEVLTNLASVFGPDSAVYAIDHAFDQLNSLTGETDITLDGRLRTELISGRIARHQGRSWVPLLERRQPVFVVSTPTEPDIDDDDTTTLGLVIGALRQRFEKLESHRRRAEMSVAAELQWDLLPARADRNDAIQVAAMLEPAYDVAGDLFDYVFDDGLWAYSLDGMGHGVQATSYSSAALAAIRNCRRKGGSLAEQFRAASEIVHDLTDGGGFVTGVGCRVGDDGAVTVVNAGHEPIRRVTEAGVRRVQLDANTPLGPGGHAYPEVELAPLAASEGLVVFSDGAAGITTPDGSTLGPDGLDELLAASWTDPPLLAAHDVGQQLMSRLAGEVRDDITIVAVSRRAPEAS